MLEGQHFEPNGRLAQFMRVAADFDQADIGFAIDALIARLDAEAGDPDLEPAGDELDGNGSEDDFMQHAFNGPGCPVADGGEPAGDERDASFPEWRPGRSGVPGLVRGMRSALEHEDAEEGDDDRCLAGDDGLAPVMTFYGLRWGSDWDEEGVEPDKVPPEWRPTPIPANDTVPA